MSKRTLIAGGLLLAAVSAMALYQSLVTVTWDDVVVSRRAKVIDGTLYVPVKDIADAYKAELAFEPQGKEAKMTSNKIITIKSGDTVKAGQWFSIDGVACYVAPQIGLSDIYGWMVKGMVRNDLKKPVQVQMEWNPGPHYIESISTGDKARHNDWTTFSEDKGNSINNDGDIVTLSPSKSQPFVLTFYSSSDVPKNAADCKLMVEFKTMLNESEMNFKTTRVFVTFAR